MNREEAIKWLKAIEKKYIHGGDEEYDNLRKIALHMAMESLEQSEPCEDTISRQTAIDAICEHGTDLERRGITVLSVANHKQVMVDVLENLPSAQSERKTGWWILWNYPGEECAICSACGEEYDQMELYIGGNDYPKYCPNCGAAMRQPEDDIPMEYFENGGTV